MDKTLQGGELLVNIHFASLKTTLCRGNFTSLCLEGTNPAAVKQSKMLPIIPRFDDQNSKLHPERDHSSHYITL